ncbi:hypothetical protein M433DRAFT_78404 [Acidomyces richmondensis BFW]|nr:hypothetical protein M433DRAFT_78404 [Acidomyces richmondensis BFW]
MPSQFEDRISKAITSYRKGDYTSIHECATALLILESTLRHRLSGCLSCSTAYATQQILSTAEEESLIKWIS